MQYTMPEKYYGLIRYIAPHNGQLKNSTETTVGNGFFCTFAAELFNLKPNKMRRILLSMIFVFCTLALTAQNSIQVNYKGSKPTISDFASAYLIAYVWDEEEDVLDEARNAAKQVWIQHRQGKPLDEGETLTIDEKNGYVVYESRDGDFTVRIEMCYWNESDQKHKLFAYNVSCFDKGKYSPGQFDGLTFYRYNNATKKMTMCEDVGFDARFMTDDGAYVSYALPRTGKDIVVTSWYDTGKREKTLKWNGRRFRF